MPDPDARRSRPVPRARSGRAGRRGSTPARRGPRPDRRWSSRGRAVRRRCPSERNLTAGQVPCQLPSSAPRDGGLRDRRCGLGRLRARGTAQRGPGRQRPAPRGRRTGHRTGDPRSGDVPDHVQVEPRLGPHRRRGARARQAPPLPPARPHDRRLQLDQRDDLPPRQPRRLRRVGGERRRRLELRRDPPVLQARRGQRARRERVPRRRRPAGRLRQPLDASARRHDARGRGAGRPPGERRPHRRAAGRRRPLPADAARRHRAAAPPTRTSIRRSSGRTSRCATRSTSSGSSSTASVRSASSSSAAGSARRSAPSAR